MPNKSQRPCYLKHFSAEQSGWNAAAHFGFDLLWHWPWKMHLTRVLNIPEAAKDMVGLLWKLCQNKFAIGAIVNAEHSRDAQMKMIEDHNTTKAIAMQENTHLGTSHICAPQEINIFVLLFHSVLTESSLWSKTGQGFHTSKVAFMYIAMWAC